MLRNLRKFRDTAAQYREIILTAPLSCRPLLENDYHKKMDEMIANAKQSVINGTAAFELYDTYGFPLDLTEDALRAKNLTVDTEGFKTCMDKQKADALQKRLSYKK